MARREALSWACWAWASMRGPWPFLGRWVGLGVAWVGIGRTEGFSPNFSLPEAAFVLQWP